MQIRLRRWNSVLLALLLVTLSGCKVLGMRTIPLEELKQKYETSASRWMMVDGTNVHYRLEGNEQGPTIIMLHGMLASLHTWDGWVERLKPYYRILRIDIPGFGLTGPMANKDYTPEYAVQLVEQMRGQLDKKYGGFDKVTLIGNSLGGFISWYYATQHPERLEKLVLIDPIAYGQPVPFIIRFGARPFFGWYAKHQTPRFIIKRNVRVVYGDADRVTDDTIDRYFELLCREGNRESMVEYFRTLIKYNHDPRIEEAVKNVKTKTLLMFGEKDRWVPPSLTERWQQDVEDIQVEIIDGAGHVPMEELPEETVKIAYRFLSEGKELPELEETASAEAPAEAPQLDSIEEEGEGAPATSDQEDGNWSANANWGTKSPENDNAKPEPEPAPAAKPAPAKPAAEPEPEPEPAKPAAPNRPKMADW